MAVRLGRFCGKRRRFWLSMQATHDLWHAERKLRVRKVQSTPPREDISTSTPNKTKT
jgi:plasmid maintenance system antidote protein VapI